MSEDNRVCASPASAGTVLDPRHQTGDDQALSVVHSLRRARLERRHHGHQPRVSVDEKLDELPAKQDGVIARFRVLDAGGTDELIARMIRRREWVRLRHGIYLNHTGVPTWNQRAWAAVLAVWPAALSRDSALRACGMKRCGVGESAPIRVAIDRARGGRTPSGIVVERLADYDAPGTAEVFAAPGQAGPGPCCRSRRAAPRRTRSR
ncbi:hypothetical protein [Nocardioides sp. B-3]|uniref:hypothetical protein n=1 Tax=Nocardioides sp. B-3 TaxID=2895565 RepID=UPI0021529AA5|nr:hypothetical protein [Nocardioides sp. B-3]UUZ60465.1 hypothetical protein LP418_06160 [Nocardioides sp. B-3]